MFNFVICGTPGTGKSSIVDLIKPELKEFNFINLGDFAIQHDCVLEYDDKLESQVIDEDKLTGELRSKVFCNERNVIECIHPDMLPSDLINLVFVCRTDNTLLYDRLKERDYNEEKITNNVQSEIFQMILDEAREMCEHQSQVIELHNDHPENLVSNAKLIVDQVRKYMSIDLQTSEHR